MPEKTFSQPNDAGITGSFAASSLQAGAVHGGDLERVAGHEGEQVTVDVRVPQVSGRHQAMPSGPQGSRPSRGGSGGRALDGPVAGSAGTLGACFSSASSARRTAVSSCGSRPAAQSSGVISTSTSGSTPWFSTPQPYSSNENAYLGTVMWVPSTSSCPGMPSMPITPPQVRVPTTGPSARSLIAAVTMSPSDPANSSATVTTGPRRPSSG